MRDHHKRESRRSAVIRGAVRTVAAAFAFLAVSAGGGSAEVVQVDDTGQGLIVTHRGNCFLVLPEHVSAGSSTFQIVTSNPATYGDAAVMPFRSANDVKLAYVSPGLENRCTQSWDSLPDTVDHLLRPGAPVVLTRVMSSGLMEGLDLVVRDVGLVTFTAILKGGDVYQGTSGAIATVEGEVVGIAINVSQPDDTLVEFLRIDQIKAELKRILDAQANTVATRIEQEATASQACEPDALPLRSVTCDRPAASAEHACSRLASGGPAVFDAGTLPITIEVEIDADAPVAVSSLTLKSVAGSGAYAVPKSIRAEVSPRADRRGYWGMFGAADVPPTGYLTLTNGSAPNARLARVVISSAWASDKPLRIDCLLLR